MTEFEEKMLQAISGINSRLDSMGEDMSDVKGDIKSIKITLETEVAPVLKMLL